MGIQFYQNLGGMSPYQNYNRPQIPEVSMEEVKQQEEAAKEAPDKQLSDYSQPVTSDKPDDRKRTADLENISLTFNREDNFDYLGSDKNIENLDIQKAISDMRKDEVLQEYQYFVGNAQALFQSEDGMVISK